MLSNNVKTVGAIVISNMKFVFMIGPNIENEIKIVRLGGHLEGDETILNCLNREVYEEARIKLNVMSSVNTYIIKNWEDRNYEIIDLDDDIRPLLIKDNGIDKKSLIYLATTDSDIIPDSEAWGIIRLSINEINYLLNNNITLDQFMNQGGEIVLQHRVDLQKIIRGGVILNTVSELYSLDESLFYGLI